VVSYDVVIPTVGRASLPRLLEALTAAGFGEDEVRAIAWDNWRRVLARAWHE
jgi:microsomal dipeptidase-like Zn-dependent dipeptidase